jgi:hypothetical protein
MDEKKVRSVHRENFINSDYYYQRLGALMAAAIDFSENSCFLNDPRI